MEPFPGTAIRTTVWGRRYVLTPEQEAWLRRWFPIVENSRIIKASGLKHSSLHRIVNRLGIRKSEEGMKGIKRRQAAHIKRLCEKNGYYDSIRGKDPHINSVEATKKTWREIKAGLRESPVEIYRKAHPRKYKAMCKKLSKLRSEVIESERLREKWGLPRKTKLNIVQLPYRRSQIQRRYNAVRRGYILASDCSEGSGYRYIIYYDDKTVRSEQFERNCIRDGFRFERW